MSSEKYLTVPHSLGVFIGERRRKAAPLALTATRVRRRALGLRVLGLRLDWLWRVSLLAVAVLFPLTLLVGQFPVLRGHGHLVGLFYFEEQWRGGAVLHGPKSTQRRKTILGSQHCKTMTWLRAGGNFSCKSQSPFLGVELDRGLLKLCLLVLGLHTNPFWVVPQLVLLQAPLCGEHCLAVGAAVTQLLSYGGLMQTQTWGEGIWIELALHTKRNDSGWVLLEALSWLITASWSSSVAHAIFADNLGCENSNEFTCFNFSGN